MGMNVGEAFLIVVFSTTRALAILSTSCSHATTASIVLQRPASTQIPWRVQAGAQQITSSRGDIASRAIRSGSIATTLFPKAIAQPQDQIPLVESNASQHGLRIGSRGILRLSRSGLIRIEGSQPWIPRPWKLLCTIQRFAWVKTRIVLLII